MGNCETFSFIRVTILRILLYIYQLIYCKFLDSLAVIEYDRSLHAVTAGSASWNRHSRPMCIRRRPTVYSSLSPIRPCDMHCIAPAVSAYTSHGESTNLSNNVFPS